MEKFNLWKKLSLFLAFMFITSMSSWAQITSFPYTQGWEGGSVGSWTQATYDDEDWSNNTGSTGSGSTGPSSANEGSHYIYCETSDGSNGDVYALESPTFDLSSLTNPSIKFDYHMRWDGNHSDGTLKLDVSTDGGSTWTTEWTKTGHQGSNWQKAIVSLASYTSSSSVKFRFHFTIGTAGSSFDYDAAIDYTEVLSISCPPPSSLAVSGAIDTTADLSWTTTASNSNIEYGSAGFTQGSGTYVADASNPYSFSGLSPKTSYDVYVQDSCGTNDVSMWAGPVTFTTTAAVQTLPFSDGFESNLNAWSFSGTGSPTTTTSEVYQGSQSLQLVKTDGDDISATIAFNPTIVDELSFAYYIEYYNDNEFSVEIQESGSSSWTKIHEFSGGYSDDDKWIDKTFDLASYNTSSGPFKIRFNAKNTDSYSDYEVYVDDFKVTTPAPNDMAVTELISPYEGLPSKNKPVKIEVANVGTNNQTNPEVSYSIDGGNNWTTDTINQTINAGNTVTHTFPSTVDMDSIMQYSVFATVNVSGDTVTNNDTISKTIGMNPAHSLPVAENFESFSGSAWNFTPTSGYRFELESGETGSSDTGPNGDHTSGSGDYLAIEASDGGTGDVAYLYSPFLDTTTFPATPKVKFFYHMYGSDMGDLYVQEYVNGSWNSIDSIKGEQQTSMSDPWLLKSTSLSSNATRVRFKAISGGSYNGDMSLDDINLPLGNDIAMTKATEPLSAIDIQSSKDVTVEVANYGLNAQSNFDVKYSLDSGNTYTTETISSTLQPDSSLTHTFSTKANISTQGIYNMVYVVDNTGDANRDNDTIKKQIENYSMPYAQDFDNVTEPDLPQGWTVLNKSDGSVETYDYEASSQPNSLDLYNSSSDNGEALMAILPPYYGGNLSNKWITMDVNSEKASEYLVVGVLTDPTDKTTFTAVDTINFASNDTWYSKYAEFSGYSGSGEYVAIKHSATDSYEDIFVDNVVLETKPTSPILGTKPDTINMAKVRYNAPDTVTSTFTVANEGIDTVEVTGISLSGANSSNFAIVDNNTYPKKLGVFDNYEIQVQFFGSSQGNKSASLDVTANVSGSSTTQNNALYGEVIDATIDSFPFVQTFETKGNVPVGWKLTSNDGDFEWNMNQGGTPSSNTGPLGDQTTGNGHYMYTEASSGDDGDTARMITPPVDISSISNPAMSFWYHMYGVEIDTFAIDVATNGSWNYNVDSLIGEQHSSHAAPWSKRTIDLSSYSNADSIQFRALCGSDYEGDISIDDVAFGKVPNVDLGVDTISTCKADTMLDAGSNTGWTYEWYAGDMNNVISTSQTLMADSTTKYYVKVTNAGGFTDMDSVSVYMNQTPVVDAGADKNICAGDTVSLTATYNNLFFSEYIEGSSNNKAIEFFNGTGKPVNLSNYAVLTNYNGSAWSGEYKFPAGITLNHGETYVVAHKDADSTILNVADEKLAFDAKGYMMGYNGNDVRALVRYTPNGDTVIIDQIGRYDMVDPGNGWDVAGVSEATADHSLIRKPDAGPNLGDWDASAGTDSISSEWIVKPQDDFSDLDTHSTSLSHKAYASVSYQWSTGDSTESISVAPSSDQMYTVTLTNAAGCSSTDTVNVHVSDPSITITGPDTMMYYTDTVTYEADTGFVSYDWSTADSTQMITIDSSNVSMGTTNTITVTVTNDQGCKATATKDIYAQDDSGIEDINDNMDISVYPNPNEGTFTLEIDGVNDDFNLEIMNINGQLIKSENINADNFSEQYHLNDLTGGVYYIRLINDDMMKTQKLIIR